MLQTFLNHPLTFVLIYEFFQIGSQNLNPINFASKQELIIFFGTWFAQSFLWNTVSSISAYFYLQKLLVSLKYYLSPLVPIQDKSYQTQFFQHPVYLKKEIIFMGTFSSYFREQNQPLGFILKHPVVHTYFPLIFFAKIQQT